MIAVGVDMGKTFLDVAVYGEQDVQRFTNTSGGLGRLVKQLSKRSPVRVLVEAARGYQQAVLDACARAGVWVARINPRQTGQFAKTDPLNARMLAEIAAVFHARLRRHEPAAGWQIELKGWLRRRRQITEGIICTRQQVTMALPTIRVLMRKTLAALQREQVVVDAAMKQLVQAHTTPALRSSKGLGPMFQATVLALLPELGRLGRQQLAKLVGVAPLNRDSDRSQGKRKICGGQALMRVVLYMATLSVVRWAANLRSHYQQLRAWGKTAKVAVCMRKLLTIINARRRDEIRACREMTCVA